MKSIRPLNYVAQGKFFEDKACSYLKGKGFKIIKRNFHSYFGEIDIIGQERQVLAFVEVRQRDTSYYGGAIASITRAKQEKLRKTAAYFLQRFPIYRNCLCRYDVVIFEGKDQVRWLKNAFI